MKRERRRFSADFKAKVALEAIKERSTVLQISSKFKISPAQVTKWKHEFLDRATTVFEKEVPDQRKRSKNFTPKSGSFRCRLIKKKRFWN
ncbi:transposase [Leadbetterella byssophila]|uniref:transposase n=1 Tax=Leadbetterella byssophila TaxID=316068 RepID=UPI0039A3C64F